MNRYMLSSPILEPVLGYPITLTRYTYARHTLHVVHDHELASTERSGQIRLLHAVALHHTPAVRDGGCRASTARDEKRFHTYTTYGGSPLAATGVVCLATLELLFALVKDWCVVTSRPMARRSATPFFVMDSVMKMRSSKRLAG